MVFLINEPLSLVSTRQCTTGAWCGKQEVNTFLWWRKVSSHHSRLLSIHKTYFEQVPPLLCGSVVSVSDSWPGGCEFDPRLRRTYFPAYFHLSSLQKHVRKVVGGFWKKSCVSTGVRKPGNTCVTDRHDMTLAVKVALNPNTTNQPLEQVPTELFCTLVLVPWQAEKQRVTTHVNLHRLCGPSFFFAEP